MVQVVTIFQRKTKYFHYFNVVFRDVDSLWRQRYNYVTIFFWKEESTTNETR